MPAKNGTEIGERSPGNEGLLGFYVLDHIYGKLRTLANEYLFLTDELLFRQIIEAFELTRRERTPALEAVRDIHRGLVDYLSTIEPTEGRGEIIELQGKGRQRIGKKFVVPEELKDFDAIVEDIGAQREDESLIEAYESAIDAVILGEVELEEIILTHRAEVREKVLEMLKNTGMDEYGGSRIFDLLPLRDESLRAREGELGQEIVAIIIEARTSIREQDSGVRTQEARKLTYPEKEIAAKVREAIPKVSLEEMEAVLKTLTDLEEKVLRMRFGIKARPETILESRLDREGVPDYTADAIRQIEARMLRRMDIPTAKPRLKMVEDEEGEEGED